MIDTSMLVMSITLVGDSRSFDLYANREQPWYMDATKPRVVTTQKYVSSLVYVIMGVGMIFGG